MPEERPEVATNVTEEAETWADAAAAEAEASVVSLRDDVDRAIAPLNRDQALILSWVDGFLLAAAGREAAKGWDPLVGRKLELLREAFPWLVELDDAR